MNMKAKAAYLVHVTKRDYAGFHQETFVTIARFKSLDTAGYEAVMGCLRHGETLTFCDPNHSRDSAGFTYFVRTVRKLDYESNKALLNHLDSLGFKKGNPASNPKLVFPSLEVLEATIEGLKKNN